MFDVVSAPCLCVCSGCCALRFQLLVDAGSCSRGKVFERCLTGTCADCVTAGSGLEVYGRFARDFDYDLFRTAAGKASNAEASASLSARPHCDAGSSSPVVIDAVSGERAALFPGGITQRAAPDFASSVSKLAASASGPAEVAASALRTQALQTGMVRKSCSSALL